MYIYATGGIGYNLLINCVNPILINGTSGLTVYNNTCYSTKDISNELLIGVYSDSTGTTRSTNNVIFKNNILKSYNNNAYYFWIDNTACTGNILYNTIIYNSGNTQITNAVHFNSGNTNYNLASAITAGIFDSTVYYLNPNLTNGVPTNILTGSTMTATYNSGLDITYDWENNIRTTKHKQILGK